MAQENLFVIQPSGEIERWEINKRRINPTQAIVNALSSGITRKAAAVFPAALIDKSMVGYANLAVEAKNYVTVSIPVGVMPMNAPFAVKDNLAWPIFDGNHPNMKMFWKVPPSMNLYLSLHLSPGYECIEQHLVAFTPDKRSWRIPVSNLYADCRLCHGRYASISNTILDCCIPAWRQFCDGAWNSDLYSDATAQRRNGAKELFAYKVNNSEITQIEFTGDWTVHCEKVATEYITNSITPP